MVAPKGQPDNVAITRTSLNLRRGGSWQDANGMVHVFGIDGDDTLKVLHQSSRSAAVQYGRTPWTNAANVAEPYCICTQDVATSFWSTDKVRLPSDEDPHVVTRHVSEVSWRDGYDHPIPVVAGTRHR